MPRWARIVLRAVTLVLLAYVALAWALHENKTWSGWLAAGAALGAYGLYRLYVWFRMRDARQEAAWEAAIYDRGKRARAIEELGRERAKFMPVKQHNRSRHARLSVLYAELLDAEGRYEEAMRAVDEVAVTVLPPLDGGLVRHTRAVTHLRGSDPSGALEALDGRVATSDDELDQRLTLLTAYARAELGEAEQALEVADEVAGDSSSHPSVVDEARIVRAAALDVLGRRSEAMDALKALDPDSLQPLSELGLPRVRGLAQQVLAGKP